MKNKFKIFALMLLPCMFLITGCGKADTSISSKQFADLVYDAGTKYFEKHISYENFDNMTISSTYTTYAEMVDEVEYKENSTDAEYVTEEFTYTTNGTVEQTVTVYTVGEGAETDIYVQITQVSNYEEKGYRANDTDETLESYTETGSDTITITFVKDGDVYKLFKSETNVYAGEETTEKEYYVYADRDAYKEAVSEVLTSINEDTMQQAFYMADSELLYLADTSYFQDGNTFGQTAELVITMFDIQDGAQLIYTKLEATYKDNKATNAKTNVEMRFDDEKMAGSSNVNITYTANAISVPTGFTTENETTTSPDIYVMGASPMIGS